MNMMSFKEIRFIDFEYSALPGENPDVRCMFARELFSGQTIELWENDLKNMDAPPFPMGGDILYVSYYAGAEMGCHLSLRWPFPTNMLDLFTEFRNLTNGTPVPCGNGLIGALTYFGIPGIHGAEKQGMRGLAIRGGPYSNEEKQSLLEYCKSDVLALEQLFKKMAPTLDMERALLRGRYMKALAVMERTGTPIDVETQNKLRKYWANIQDEIIEKIDSEYGVYEGRTFKYEKFARWLCKKNIAWPRLPSGRLDLGDKTFKEMTNIHPEVGPLRELRQSLSKMRLEQISVGRDGRNRCMLSAFRSKTGRNQPSTNKFIFGPATWLRGLIKPFPGYGVAYVDWCQQEFGIAAALSEDPVMMDAYQSGDPYLAFAKQAGAVPENATKETHHRERALYKGCALAVQYGMGAESLSIRIGQPVNIARELLQKHHITYQRFWEWSDACLNYALLYGSITTVFGWKYNIDENPNPRSIRNFPMQANGAEMLRLACCLLTEQEIRVCAPVHDALLIEFPINKKEEIINKTQEVMAESSSIILNGLKLRTDVEIIEYPNRYMDKRGEKMWNVIMEIINTKNNNLSAK